MMLRIERIAHTWIQMWVVYHHAARQFENHPRYLSLDQKVRAEVARGNYQTAAAYRLQIDELRERMVLDLLKPIDLLSIALHRQEEFDNVLLEVNKQAPLYPEFIELRGGPSYGF